MQDSAYKPYQFICSILRTQLTNPTVAVIAAVLNAFAYSDLPVLGYIWKAHNLTNPTVAVIARQYLETSITSIQWPVLTSIDQ